MTERFFISDSISLKFRIEKPDTIEVEITVIPADEMMLSIVKSTDLNALKMTRKVLDAAIAKAERLHVRPADQM